jgi:serine phosphatase RsbU (regulator of sigma subunit)
MSDGITEAYRKVDKETELKMDIKYIKSLISEAQMALEALERRIEDK